MSELNMEEMGEIFGGNDDGGYAKKPGAKKGCKIYQIQPGDTLYKIAKNNKTSVDAIMKVNPEIKDRSLIRAGHYIYIPA